MYQCSTNPVDRSLWVFSVIAVQMQRMCVSIVNQCFTLDLQVDILLHQSGLYWTIYFPALINDYTI